MIVLFVEDQNHLPSVIAKKVHVDYTNLKEEEIN